MIDFTNENEIEFDKVIALLILFQTRKFMQI